ncbi:MAG: ribosomal L7Ae/L30e/S12e/Gadd45 family protein [Oscillospiraceae bacterium]
MNSKVLQDISLIKRTGNLILGFDVVKASLREGTAVLLVTANDLSAKTNKEVAFLQEKYNIPHITIRHTLDELWYVLGKRVGVMSVTDKGLSEKITKDNCEEDNCENVII